MKQTLGFADYLPDQPDFQNPGVPLATNVVPKARTFGPLAALAGYTAALAAAPKGAYSFQRDGTNYVFAGTATALYKLQAAKTWETVTRSSGVAYATATDDAWRFVDFGDYVVAVNGTDATQYYDVGSSTDFEPLSGSPPIAHHIAIVKQFLVLGNLSTDSTALRWCAQGNVTSWTIGVGLAGDQILPDGGEILGLVGGEYGLIFQRRAIQRMDYQPGSPLIFSFAPLVSGENSVGCMAAGSIVEHRGGVYFISDNGFEYCDGVSVRNIGTQRVNDFFLTDCDRALTYLITASVDPVLGIIMWSYPGQGNSGAANHQLIYNPFVDKWSYAEQTAQFLMQGYSFGYTLDDLDAITTNLDLLPYSLDSVYWQTGAVLLGGFDSNNKFGFFNGLALEATIETTEWGGDTTSKVISARPLVAGVSTCEVEIGSRYMQASDPTYTTAAVMNDRGKCNMRSNGRYHRARLTIPSQTFWQHAQGVDIEFEYTGDR
jgi:hypothetical protein